MANSLHFVRDKPPALRPLLRSVRPGGRFVLVEYDADRGYPWVPFPLSFETWRAMAGDLGLEGTRLSGRVPSRFLGAIYSAVSIVSVRSPAPARCTTPAALRSRRPDSSPCGQASRRAPGR